MMTIYKKSGWFDDARIERTVTKSFVCSFLTPEEIADLDKPLAFGDGLTNDTYWEWIESKAKRLFLILVDLDVPDQIFGVIDDLGWEDDDLPLPRDQVHQLALTEERDSKFDAKFYDQQFHYLLRTLDAGQHVDYNNDEMVPLDVVEKRPLASSHQDVVELPNYPRRIFGRRAVQLGLHMSMDEFTSNINMIRTLQNDHIESYFASYTHNDIGYVLFTPASEYKLASYLTNTPASLKALDKLSQRRLVLEWINCLVDTLCYIHSRGEAVGNIKSSTVLATHDHHILFPDSTYFNPDTHNPKSFSKENYDYAAPEQCSRPPGPPSPPITRPRATRTASGGLSTKSQSSSAPRGRGAGVAPSPTTETAPSHHHRPIRVPSASPAPRSSSRRPTHLPLPSSPTTASNPAQAADIFSLGCVLLELLSHLLKRSPSAFAAVRSAKHKNPGRGGAVLDASFHRNLGQVQVWMAGLAKDAEKKTRKSGSSGDGADDDKARVYAAVGPLLTVVERMLAVQPGDRPSATLVKEWVFRIVTDVGGLPAPHCVDRWCGGDPTSAVSRSSGSYSVTNSTSLDGLGTGRSDDSYVSSLHNRESSGTSSRTPSSAATIRSKRSSMFSVQSWGTHHREHDGGDPMPSLGPSVSQPGEDRWGAAVMQSLKMGVARSKFSTDPPLARSVVSGLGS